MSYSNCIHAKAVELTKLAIEMTTAAGSGHPTSGASLSHLIAALMYDHMRFDPADPGHAASDRLVLSEGHAVPIVYAACADLGVRVRFADGWRAMNRDDALTLRQHDSPIDGHPNPEEGFPFFDAATGSLGQGLGVAAGIALAARLDKLDRRIFCLIGDGEAREGQVWEAVDFIADHGLAAVCPIFNCNAFAQSDATAPQQSPDAIAARLAAVGYEVADIDGHEPSAIQRALAAHTENQHGNGEPFAIVARTVKGWGAKSQQGNGHHGTPVKADELASVFAEYDATAEQLGAAWSDGVLSIRPITDAPPKRAEWSAVPTLVDTLESIGKADALAKGKWATRRAYGATLQALGHANADIVALDADVQGSTGAASFAKDATLAGRFFECRIAEQNMVSVAAGLGAGGKIAFASTFAKFLTRGYDQIEMAINSGLNFKLVGSHAGVSLGADGPSQMGMPDVAWFGAFTKVQRPGGKGPAMFLLNPADAFAEHALLRLMAEHDGPCYMRTMRPDTELLYDDKTPFSLGGCEVVHEGADLLICASGYMVSVANKALDALGDAGIDATLLDLYSLPFDEEVVCDLAETHGGRVLTLEDNYAGGFGSAVADALTSRGNPVRVKQLYVTATPKSALSPDEVLGALGLDEAGIIAAATALLETTKA